MKNLNNYYLVKLDSLIVTLTSIFLLGLIVSLLFIPKAKGEVEIVPIEVEEETITFKDSVVNLINTLDIHSPKVVLAQAILESGHFKSKVFKENNNLFGMKEPSIRKTLALGTKNGHAYYKNWKDSVIDYYLYQEAYHNIKEPKDEKYLKRLSRSYAEDPKYIQKLQILMADL